MVGVAIGSFTAFMSKVAATCDEPAVAEAEAPEAPLKSEVEMYLESCRTLTWRKIYWSGGQGTKRSCQICPEWQDNT
jgi:hypothetical protein